MNKISEQLSSLKFALAFVLLVASFASCKNSTKNLCYRWKLHVFSSTDKNGIQSETVLINIKNKQNAIEDIQSIIGPLFYKSGSFVILESEDGSLSLGPFYPKFIEGALPYTFKNDKGKNTSLGKHATLYSLCETLYDNCLQEIESLKEYRGKP